MSSKKNETRNRILQTTWDLLESGDALNTRMSDIAKAAKISRQALYLHFPNRAELLTATAKYIDEIKDIDARLAPSRSAANGSERLIAYIEAWGNYIPEIIGVAHALMGMMDSDQEAAAAWTNRMQAMRHGCAAAVSALKDDGVLTSELSEIEATDLLWTLLSVRNWTHLVQDCGWPQTQYITHITRLAERALIESN